ncbi:protein unc-13 homolog [Vigna umbellata]|uniref:protein unc-13 homolog n=1 Tax=Vigna umbellata TaxID=87088 RepID=UPI001F5ED84B|nr:protein unc-13 homolog [Vigna umbellata]
MGHHTRRESYPSATSSRLDYHVHSQRRPDTNALSWPFGKLHGLDDDQVRETAYEIFFTSCRSSPGFGGRHALTFYSNHESNGSGGEGGKTNQVVTKPMSRVKNMLGLRMVKNSPSRRMVSTGVSSMPSSPVGAPGSPLSGSVPSFKPRRPMTAAEIMRQQMRVTEHDDYRLRKTLMRTLVGQMGRRAETIILPLELIRHLKPSEFSDSQEYHMWQIRQLKVLEAGLLLYPAIPLEKTSTFATRLRDIVTSGESQPIDAGKNSDTMRSLCNSVVSLSWRTHDGTPADVCHWADGFPFNIHLYTSLLQSIFDVRDETLVLDEVDELLELMKKTWSILGITLPIHNVCFAWVLFKQYVTTGQIEADLLCASHAMMNEVANDAKREKESMYVKIVSSVLSSMQSWAEKRLLNYHEYFQRGNAGQIENLVPVVLTASKILGEDLTFTEGEREQKGGTAIVDYRDRIDNYIRSSMKHAFDKVLETVNAKSAESERRKEFSEVMLQLVQETEALMLKERHHFSPILKKWHSTAGAVAAMVLHSCFGKMLKQYVSEVNSLTTESVQVLKKSGKLEKGIVQMMVEEASECDDGGKTVFREMAPYDVDSIILSLLGKWIDDSLLQGKLYLQAAKDTETWNANSKSESYAQSAAELMKLARTTVEEFFKVPIAITEDLVQDLVDGLENLFHDYMKFVASCGSKQSFIPMLPPLTRCNSDSTFTKLWKMAAPCSAGFEAHLRNINGKHESQKPRPSTSRGTQRLYVRLNTLHYLLYQIHSLERTITMNPGVIPSNRLRFASNRKSSGSFFESVNLSILVACQHVSEVAAYRLVFHDSASVLYDGLYVGGVARGQMKAALRILKQNLTLMTTTLTGKAEPLALKEVMKASYDAFLMVLLSGGSSRVFSRYDHEVIREDFENLKRVFSNSVEGLIAENVVDGEAAVVEGVIALMGQSSEQLIEDLSLVICTSSAIGLMGNGLKLPMPPTTGKWHRSDPNTILRVLCHRNERAANLFLKKTFQLPRRK